MPEQIILFGAGQLGQEALAFLRSQAREPVCFVDTSAAKQGTEIDGLRVCSAAAAQLEFPEAIWVATVLSLPASQEVPDLMRKMGVETMPTWQVLPEARKDAPYKVGARHGRWPSEDGFYAALRLLEDAESVAELCKQRDFYCHPDYFVSQKFHALDEIYFPGFIKQRNDEHFVDCGAADGDSIALFLEWAQEYQAILAIEPDDKNIAKLVQAHGDNHRFSLFSGVVSDSKGTVGFKATGDYCSRIAIDGDGNTAVAALRIDDLPTPPTFVKMDVEGAEPEALWGARRTLREHSPVLAICAYHETEHFWQIPLLIHALQPEYKLFFRRYSTVPFELVCYAVPKGRLR